MKKNFTVITISCLTFLLMLTACSSPTTNHNGDNGTDGQSHLSDTSNQETATLGQIIDYIIKANNGDTPINREDLLAYLKGKEDSQASRLQAYVAVSQVFGHLLESDTPSDVDLSGVPEWAKKDLEILKQSGVLTSKELAGGIEDNQRFNSVEDPNSSAEPSNDLRADNTADINNGDISAIIDEDTPDTDENKILGEINGCPLGGGSDDNPELERDVTEKSLSIRSIISLSDVEIVINRILSLKK